MSVNSGSYSKFICSLNVSVAAHQIVWADLSARYTVHVDGKVSNQERNILKSPQVGASHEQQ